MRRANGTGSIVKYKGNRRKPYIVRIPYHDENGAVKHKMLGSYATQKDAQTALEEYNMRHRIGIAPAPADLGATVQQCYEIWSERHYKKVGVNRAGALKIAWEKRVSSVADRHIRELRAADWQLILDNIADEGVGKKPADDALTVIRGINEVAMQNDFIMKDYSQFVHMPETHGKTQQRGAFTPDQMTALEALVAAGHPHADIALALCYTGFRIEELLKLTPSDYDPVLRGFVGGSKTFAGKDRFVPVHPKIQSIVDGYLKKNGQTIFCKSDGKKIPYNTELGHFKAVAKEIGCDGATPHWARHTFTSMCRIAKLDEMMVKKIVGHRISDMTEHYTHFTPQQLYDELAKLP